MNRPGFVDNRAGCAPWLVMAGIIAWWQGDTFGWPQWLRITCYVLAGLGMVFLLLPSESPFARNRRRAAEAAAREEQAETEGDSNEEPKA